MRRQIHPLLDHLFIDMAADYFDYGLDGVPPVDATDWDDVAALLEQSHEERSERLEQELEEMAQQLDERDRIHRAIVDRLEWKIERYTDRLSQLYGMGKGKADGTRHRMKNRIEAFYQELRDEHQAHWRDRQELEQERREVRRELDEAQDDTLSDLL